MAKFEDVRNVMVEVAPDRAFRLELIGRIKGKREVQGLSQSELSRKSGVPQKTISRMENGLSVPAMDTLGKLVDALGFKIPFKLEEK